MVWGSTVFVPLALAGASLTNSPVLCLSERRLDVSVKGEEEPEHIYID